MSKHLYFKNFSLPPQQKRQSLLDDLCCDSPDLLTFVKLQPAAGDLLAHIADGSPFLAGIVRRYPSFALEALTDDPEVTLNHVCGALEKQAGEAGTKADLMVALRIARNHVALLVALADIAGAWNCAAVTGALTRFADLAVFTAVNWLLEEAVDLGKLLPGKKQNPADGFTVLAMGKHGAAELNYSSDIDIIVLYDPDAAPLKDVDTASEFYVRLTRALVTILQDRTSDGYVFRVDLRLRPDPRATQIAIAVEAAGNYYESMGQNWERAAMIKARPIAGDIALGQAFLRHLIPFIWRKYLDFAAIADVQSLKRQMHAHKGHSSIAILGHNIKLGRGGIREIEFFVQTQQLIAGGRNPDLRGARTQDMLQQLVMAGWLEQSACDELNEAYVFLRTIEHRIQMVADEQTQTLPGSKEAFDAFARFCGFDKSDDLADRLLKTFTTVQGHYSGLFENAAELDSDGGSLVFTGGEDDPETLETLKRLGFEQASEVSASIRGWHFGRYPATRSSAARERLTELMPVLLKALAATGHADQAFLAFDRFIAGLPAGVQLFSMFKANPFLLDLLASVLGSAPRLAESLSRRPRQLEAVLDPSFFGPMPEPVELQEGFQALSTHSSLFEEVLDTTRVEAREKSLRIGIRILSETVSPTQAGLAYSNLADAVIEHLLKVTLKDISDRHGKVTKGEMVVIALGKLGGGEMTAASDLDLIMLYDFSPGAETSSGKKPLSPAQYFSRTAQRLITALTSQTAEGDLYEVDMRLRPSGNKGPVATSVDGFESYQANEAWTWEKMALTRARVVAGDKPLQARVEAIIRKILCTERDPNSTLNDVREMRMRMLEASPVSDIWDLKHVRGGLIEIEFIAQGLQLVHANKSPDVLNRSTIKALEILRDHGHLSHQHHDHLATATALYQGLTHVLRLCASDGFSPKNAPSGLLNLLLRAGAAPDLATLEAALHEANRQVSAIFDELIGSPEKA